MNFFQKIRLSSGYAKGIYLVARPLLSIFFVMSSLICKAQIAVDLSQFESTQNVTLKCLILDAGTLEALPYVSVYLIPQGDTTITHFAMSSDRGAVKNMN